MTISGASAHGRVTGAATECARRVSMVMIAAGMTVADLALHFIGRDGS